MNKSVILLCATVGGFIGSYVPVVLFGVDGLSVWSILGGVAGGLAGIWAGARLGR